VTVGIATSTEQASPQQVLDGAARAAYDGKNTGRRNRVLHGAPVALSIDGAD
jgi:PleD family two-component response regulator